MYAVTQQINEMLNIIPEREQLIIFEVIKRFVPDNMATPDDLRAIKTARMEYNNGETTDFNNIDWD